MSVLPKVFRIRQRFEGPVVGDVGREVQSQLSQCDLQMVIRPGQTVAITAGSRGIVDIDRIMAAIVSYLKSIAAEPFVVPAMGSHGGGTAQGQRELLASYGITEERVGCPIKSDMGTVVIGQAAEGFPIHFDRHALQADHVLVCNRVKPHTHFGGDIQSGLLKMLVIGLGKRVGAETCHGAIVDYGFPQVVQSVSSIILGTCRIVAGLAILENGHGQAGMIEVVRPDQFVSREKELLTLARNWMAKLPFDRADVLIVDQIGKNISGAGMDPNVIGRKGDDPADAKAGPCVRRILVRGLTEESMGNGCGIGLADFCTTGTLEQIDWNATRTNALVSGDIAVAKRPLDFSTDKQMLDAALSTVGLTEPENSRLMWIKNTKDLTRLVCSTAYLDEANSRDDLDIFSKPYDLPLDESGNLAG